MKKKIVTKAKAKVATNSVVVFQTKTGAFELKGDFTRETVWATQAQIAEVCEIERSVVTKYINNILKTKELEEKSVCAKFAHTASDGKTYVVQYYSLDMAISVGYRVNSKKVTLFRQWATKILREHLVKSYALNKKVILKNYDQFIKNVSGIQVPLFRTLNF